MITYAIWMVIALSVIAILIIATRALDVPVPEWAKQVLGVVLIVVVLVLALRFIGTL